MEIFYYNNPGSEVLNLVLLVLMIQITSENEPPTVSKQTQP